MQSHCTRNWQLVAALCGIRLNGSRGALGFFQNAPLNFGVAFSDPMGADESSAARGGRGFRPDARDWAVALNCTSGVIAATPNDEFGSLKGHCEKFANATEADHSDPAAIVLTALLARWGVGSGFGAQGLELVQRSGRVHCHLFRE